MKIHFKRTGGVAGMCLTATVDTKAVTSKEADHLHHLVAECSLFDQPEALKSSPGGADQFQYSVKVEDKGRRKEIQMDELAVPDVFRPLLNYLLRCAKTKKK